MADLRRVRVVPHSQLPYALQFISHGNAAPVVGTHQRLPNVGSPAGAPTPALKAPTVKSTSKHSPYVYFIIIRLQLVLLFTVCVCVRACVCACVRARVCVCVCARPITSLSHDKIALLRNFTPFDGDVHHEN